jgi:hypothetical protein
MGRRSRQENTTPQKTKINSTEDLVEKERNEYPAANPSRMRISMSNEFNEDLKEVLKEVFTKDFKEELRKDLKEKLTENIQKQLKEYQEDTDKKLEKRSGAGCSQLYS